MSQNPPPKAPTLTLALQDLTHLTSLSAGWYEEDGETIALGGPLPPEPYQEAQELIKGLVKRGTPPPYVYPTVGLIGVSGVSLEWDHPRELSLVWEPSETSWSLWTREHGLEGLSWEAALSLIVERGLLSHGVDPGAEGHHGGEDHHG